MINCDCWVPPHTVPEHKQWECNLLVRRAKLSQRVMLTKSKLWNGYYWPSNLTFLLVHILSWIRFSKCRYVQKKKILRNISHQSISHRKVQESKYLSGINHSACHIVEVKTVRTSGGEDPYVLNAQAISVIFQLPISAKSRVQVIFGSQYI